MSADPVNAVETTPGTPEEENTSVLAPAANPDLRWYVVHAYSGMEKAVERNITERINRAGMQDKFGRILVPTEEVVEIKNGQKRTTERRFFPGYVLVEMIMDDESWHLVKHTNKVTGFRGRRQEPSGPDLAERGRGHRQPDAAGHREAAPQGRIHRG